LLEVLDLTSRRGEVTAKTLSRELGVSLSTCYHLIGILLEEGYIEKLPRRGAYRLGPAISVLHERNLAGNSKLEVEPLLDELAGRSMRPAYFGMLSGGALAVSHVKAPPGSPPVGLGRGFHGASHALALGKVLLAGMGPEEIRRYADRRELEVFTPKTVVRPAAFELQLERIKAQGFATDVEEFAENLCCVAAPVLGRGGEVVGAVGVSTSARRFGAEARSLLNQVRRAAAEASLELGTRRNERRTRLTLLE
jgi:acetyl-CoA synthetase